MHRCHGVECIVDRHLYFIAAVHADNWPENWRRVAIGSRRLPVNERVPAGHHLEVDRIPLFGCVDECRDWQTGIERRGISKAVSRTDKSTRCECSAADCKVASCQGHGLRGIGCTIPLSGGRSSLPGQSPCRHEQNRDCEGCGRPGFLPECLRAGS